MVKKYYPERTFMETNPSVHPKMREWVKAVNETVTWATTTTTSTTTTTTTSTTTTTT